MNAYPFRGKHALVTGGTKGMGEAIVRRLAHDGATVIVTARQRPSEPLAGVRLRSSTRPAIASDAMLHGPPRH